MIMIKSDIDGGKCFDWGRTSEDYAKYRDIYPEEFYAKIIETGLCLRGQRVLDLGTGTGVLPRSLHKHGAEFVGVDISEAQIRQARLLSEKAGMNISYMVASAESFDFPDSSFDVVTACQCFQYFDKAVSLPRIHKVLKDRGHFCILFMMWLIEESEIAANSEKIVLKYNPYWSAHSCKRFRIDSPKEAEGLFEVADSILYDIPVAFTRESWHGRMKACRGIGASSLSEETIALWEEEHIEYLKSVPESFTVEHFVTALNLRKTGD